MSRHLSEYEDFVIQSNTPKWLQEISEIKKLIKQNKISEAQQMYWKSESWSPEIEIKLAQAELSINEGKNQTESYKKALSKLAEKSVEFPNYTILQYMLGDDLQWYQSLCGENTEDIFGKDGIPKLTDLSDIALCVYFLHDLINTQKSNTSKILSDEQKSVILEKQNAIIQLSKNKRNCGPFFSQLVEDVEMSKLVLEIERYDIFEKLRYIRDEEKFYEIYSYYSNRFDQLIDLQEKSVNSNDEENYVSVLLMQSLLSNFFYFYQPGIYKLDYTNIWSPYELAEWEQEIERRRQNVLFSLGPNAHFFSLKK